MPRWSKGSKDNTISLAKGCICCELRDDLVESLEGLLSRREEIDYVIVEASGIAEPSGIVMTFLDQRYERLFRLDSITCLVDAEGIFAYDDGLNALKLRQIGFADLVALNKTDLVGPEHIEVIRDWIGLHMKRVRIIEATHGDPPMEVLLGVDRFDAAEVRDNAELPHLHSRSGGVDFDRWSYRSTEPFSLDALREMVKRELPESVYRCKGIIYTSDAPDRRRALQVVGRRTQIVEIGEWDERPARNEIVAIGRDMDRHQLTQLFDTCRA
jgi:G3E family GTPase